MDKNLNKEAILKAAIEKAVKNNFELMIKFIPIWSFELSEEVVIKVIISKHCALQIIFNHDFAKAFFGEEEVMRNGLNKMDYVLRWTEDHKKAYGLEEAKNIAIDDWEYFKKQGQIKPVWKFHLQIMVLEEDPLKYLEKFL